MLAHFLGGGASFQMSDWHVIQQICIRKFSFAELKFCANMVVINLQGGTWNDPVFDLLIKSLFAEWAQNNVVLFNNVWFSDEAHFDGEVNKQNVWFWVSENPRVIHVKAHRALRITAWFAISSHGLLGSTFFEETVNSECYLSTLHNTFVPHLLATGLPLQTQWFMENGARPHIANVVLDFLHDTIDSCVISNRFSDHFTQRELAPEYSWVKPMWLSSLGIP
jgi:hypothetical protein